MPEVGVPESEAGLLELVLFELKASLSVDCDLIRGLRGVVGERATMEERPYAD